MSDTIPAAFRRTQSGLCLLALATVASCGGGEGTTGPRTTAGVKAVTGMGVSDTIEAQPLQALIAEVRGPDGKPVRGAVVRFEARPPSDTTLRGIAAISVCAISAPQCGTFGATSSDQFASDTTDADGRAKAMVRLGRVAGTAVVRLAVPEFAYVDSASYTVRPGALVGVRAAARDTTLDINTSAVLRGRAVDRFGNTRTESPAVSIGPGAAVTLDAGTARIDARSLGEQWVFTTLGTFRDSTLVRAVPPGRLVLWSSDSRLVYLVNVNGGDRRVIASGVSSDYGAFPRFDESRRFVTMLNGTGTWGGNAGYVAVVDTASGARRNITSAGFVNAIATRRMADGSTLVVADRQGAGFALWRVSETDEVTLAGSLPGGLVRYGAADISADGRWIAYTVRNANGYSSDVAVLDRSQAVSKVVVSNAATPRWSPQGDRLAYIGDGSGQPGVVNADGTGARTVGSSNLSPGLAWSPDGTYLLGRSSTWEAGMRIIRIADGLTLTLRFKVPGYSNYYEDFFQPDWR